MQRNMMNSMKLSEFHVRQGSQPAGGGYGNVWDAWHSKHCRVAVKLLRNNMSQDDFKKEAESTLIASQQLSGVPMIGYIFERGNHQNHLGFVLQFMPCGSIYDVLHKFEIYIPRCLMYRILHEISYCMSKLHELSSDQRFRHFDLKSSNILLDQDLHVKVADFGAACLSTISIEQTNPVQEESPVYTCAYCAPEFLNTGQRSSKYDVYSFAIMMWEILTKKIPFNELSQSTFKQMVCGFGHRPSLEEVTNDEHSDGIKDLIQRSWDGNPEQRPSFADIEEKLRRIWASFAQSQLDDAVKSVKDTILEKLNRTTFAVVPDEYQQNLADLLNAAPPNGAENPPHQIFQPQGDLVFSSDTPARNQDRRYLTDGDCVKLGSELYYSSGWEVLGFRLGLPRNVIENINLDSRGAEQKKIELFRKWKQLNGGGQPLVASLVKVLRENNVSIDIWEFLTEPERT